MKGNNKVTLVDYVWIDADNSYRFKTKVVHNKIESIDELEIWNFDGSSTGQSVGKITEVLLKPVKIYKNPFRLSNKTSTSLMVLCETFDKNMVPIKSNKRNKAFKIFNKKQKNEPLFGLEQEYIITKRELNKSFSLFGEHPEKINGKYYCGIGHEFSYGRHIAEVHLHYCLVAGIKICGINQEVTASQWEYQIGPSLGIDAGDDLHMSRYVLYRLSEMFKVNIELHPKPIKNENGSGCHVNFSTKKMREGYTNKNGKYYNGLHYIMKAIDKLGNKHTTHMKKYGKDNDMRMTGIHETASYDKFDYSVGGRSSSIRIPTNVYKNKKGYFEDRRPASNMDPYVVTKLIYKTSCLDN